ncbi:MAG: multidrug efflux SMR transporter [bacterium]|nr:multidrug efflux SMR transporter [bacterium]
MSWIYLVLAILFEVAGTTCMKFSDGFTRLIPSVLLFVFYIISFTFLTFALKKIDIGIAYAIWSGLGTFIITLIGIFWFSEPATAIKMISISLIVLGVVGLNLSKVAH